MQAVGAVLNVRRMHDFRMRVLLPRSLALLPSVRAGFHPDCLPRESLLQFLQSLFARLIIEPLKCIDNLIISIFSVKREGSMSRSVRLTASDFCGVQTLVCLRSLHLSSMLLANLFEDALQPRGDIPGAYNYLYCTVLGNKAS